MTNDRIQRIRERAHEIWEKAGCPEGRDVEHWEQARRELDAEGERDGAAEYNAMVQGGGGGGGGAQGLATSLQPGGTAPAGGPGTMVGSSGTGGGSTAARPTGGAKRRAESGKSKLSGS